MQRRLVVGVAIILGMEIFGETCTRGQVPGTFPPALDEYDAQVLVLSHHIT
jgi:hypothetical protein